MNKKLALVAVVAIVVSAMGCQLMDSLFFNADEIKSSELASFTGDTPSTKDEALSSVVMGIAASANASGIMSSIVQAPSAIPQSLARAFAAVDGAEEAYSRTTALARTITPSNAWESFAADIDADGKGSVEVDLVAEDFGTEGIITVDGTIKARVQGLTDTSTEASGSIKAELSATVESFTGTAFNGAIINLKLDADADASIQATTGYLESLSGYAAFATYAGFSLDEIEGVCKGGKYVLGVKYTSSYKYSATSTDPTASLEAELELKVYDATDKLIGDYTYTDDEIYAISEEMSF